MITTPSTALTCLAEYTAANLGSEKAGRFQVYLTKLLGSLHKWAYFARRGKLTLGLKVTSNVEGEHGLLKSHHGGGKVGVKSEFGQIVANSRRLPQSRELTKRIQRLKHFTRTSTQSHEVDAPYRQILDVYLQGRWPTNTCASIWPRAFGSWNGRQRSSLRPSRLPRRRGTLGHSIYT